MSAATMRVQSPNEFDARLEQEDKEAMQIPCPLVERCGALAGERCCTEAGQPRVRHARRLWEARRSNGS